MTPAGWPPCSSRQATTPSSSDSVWKDLHRADRWKSSRASGWSGRPVISVGSDRGFGARGSSDPALGMLGSCTRPAPTFCVGTAAAWSTRANARTRKAEPPSGPTACERAWETMATSSTRSRSDRLACTTEPISVSAMRLTRRRTWPSSAAWRRARTAAKRRVGPLLERTRTKTPAEAEAGAGARLMSTTSSPTSCAISDSPVDHRSIWSFRCSGPTVAVITPLGTGRTRPAPAENDRFTSLSVIRTNSVMKSAGGSGKEFFEKLLLRSNRARPEPQ
jgi:hypothetical protein